MVSLVIGTAQAEEDERPAASLDREAAEGWSAAKDTDSPALIEQFIKRYRTTTYVEKARARLKEITSPWPTVTPFAPPPPMRTIDPSHSNGSNRSARQDQELSRKAAAKSEAAESWDAVKDTTSPAQLETFIKHYGSTFFAQIARTRLDALKVEATKSLPSARPIRIEHTIPPDGVHPRAVLYDEDPSNQTGGQFIGTVTWHSETIKTLGKPEEEVFASADVEIPSRGLQMKMSLKRNLDPSLPASHIIELTFQLLPGFEGGGVADAPGILMKSNEEARAQPLAGLAVKVTDGVFLAGLSNVPKDKTRNLKLLLERSWLDFPIRYENQQRAILAIEKGEPGDQVFKTVFTAWGQYSDVMQSAADGGKAGDR